MKTIILFIVIVFSFYSCKKEETPLNLPGSWEEVLPANFDTAQNYSTFSIFFDCGKYYKLKIKTHINSSTSTEYIKGEYLKNVDNIVLKGVFYSDSNYSIVADSSHENRYGDYQETYTYTLDSKHLFLNYKNTINPQINRLTQTSTLDCR